MKHSIKPYSKDISDVQRSFYKSTMEYLIPSWCIKEKRKLKQKALQDCTYRVNENESENIPIFVEERGDAFPASPSLDA